MDHQERWPQLFSLAGLSHLYNPVSLFQSSAPLLSMHPLKNDGRPEREMFGIMSPFSHNESMFSVTQAFVLRRTR